MKCPVCAGTHDGKCLYEDKTCELAVSTGPGRFFKGFAQSFKGSMMEIPADVEFVWCKTHNMRCLNQEAAMRLHEAEKAVLKRKADERTQL